MNAEAAFFGDFYLASLDRRVEKFLYPSALQANQMVVMTALVEFENRFTAFEVMAHQEAGRLKLCQDTVDRR